MSEASSQRANRPKYLVVALVVALLFGAGCWMDGCNAIALYKGGHLNPSHASQGIDGEADRAQVEQLFTRFVDLANTHRSRGIPIGAATLVLGAALLAVGTRALAGRTAARSLLIQLVLVQAAVVAAGFFLNGDIRAAELDWYTARTLALARQDGSDAIKLAQLETLMAGTRRYGVPAWIAIRSVASLLVAFALTRPPARRFFDAVAEAASE